MGDARRGYPRGRLIARYAYRHYDRFVSDVGQGNCISLRPVSRPVGNRSGAFVVRYVARRGPRYGKGNDAGSEARIRVCGNVPSAGQREPRAVEGPYAHRLAVGQGDGAGRDHVGCNDMGRRLINVDDDQVRFRAVCCRPGPSPRPSGMPTVRRPSAMPLR